MEQTTVSFPGLGIGEFTMDRAAFSIGDFAIYWYAIFITTGMILAFIHAYLRCKQEGIKGDDILDVGLWLLPCGVLGARLFYVLFDYIDRPDNYKTIGDIFAIRDGGLAIYGGVIAGALAIFFVTRHKKINTLKVMDTIAPGVMIAQSLGRWGNFVNGEAHGGVVSEKNPLYFLRMGLYKYGELDFYHPTFLYESLWNLTGFILITALYRKKKFNGQIVLAYIGWYGFGRMFIEGLRTDSLWIIPGVIRVSQMIGALCFVAGVGFTITCFQLRKRGLWTRWLEVQWAESVPVTAAPAAGETPGETSATVAETPTDSQEETTHQTDTEGDQSHGTNH